MGTSRDRRVAALLAAGLLAGSGAAAASASEWDSQDEGPAAPAEPTSGDEVGGPGEETPLPVVVQPLPDEPPPTAPAPVAPLTVDGPDAPVPEAQEAPPVEASPVAAPPDQAPSAPAPVSPAPVDREVVGGPLLVEELRARVSVPALVLEGVHKQVPRGATSHSTVSVVASVPDTAPADVATVVRGKR